MSSSRPNEHEPGPVVTGVFLVACVGLGGFLRFYHFWIPDLWIDEYMTQWIVGEDTWREVVQRAGVNHTQSPLYYLIVKLATDWLGSNAFALRLPSVLFGIGLVALAYPLGLLIFRRRYAALLTGAVFAVNSTLIWFSQEARPYSLALLCAVLSFLAYLHLLDRIRWVWCIVYVLSTSAAYYAHALFGFVASIQFVHLVWMSGWGVLRSRSWLGMFLGIAVLCLPTLSRILALYENRQTLDWISPIGGPAPIRLLEQFLQPLSVVVIVLAVLAIGVADHADAVRADPGRRRLLFLWLLSPIAVFGLVPYLFGISLLWDRYILYALPAGLLFVVWVMTLGSSVRWRRWVPLAAYLAFIVAVGLLPSFRQNGVFADRPVQGWKGATALLNTFAGPEDLVLYNTGFIEANQLPFSKDQALMEGYIQFPVTANLPLDHPYALVALPARVNDVTRPYVVSVMERAAQHRRIWLLGIGDRVLSEYSKELVLIGFRPVDPVKFGGLPRYGKVKIVLFERA